MIKICHDCIHFSTYADMDFAKNIILQTVCNNKHIDYEVGIETLNGSRRECQEFKPKYTTCGDCRYLNNREECMGQKNMPKTGKTTKSCDDFKPVV